MERLTKEIVTKQGKVVVYTEGKYNDTTAGEMECCDIRNVLRQLSDYENTGLTPEQIRVLKERDTAKAPEENQDAFGDGRLICPNCRNSVINYFNRSRPPQFCMICGQRLKWRRIKWED